MEKGTTVFLKSGGPSMTVIGENSDGAVDLGYFEGGRYQALTLPKEVLTSKDPLPKLAAQREKLLEAERAKELEEEEAIRE